MEEYICIKKKWIKDRINQLKAYDNDAANSAKLAYAEVILNSIFLQPLLEDAFSAGEVFGEYEATGKRRFRDAVPFEQYLENLKIQ